MPDSRPLPSMRSGVYDDPPASSEASTPHTRRQRLRRAILGTNELAQEVINMADSERQGRRSTVGGLTRRRQRSSSERDDFSNSAREREGWAGRRSAKRRRLTRSSPPPTRKALRYGHYGSVEPGRLQLSLVCCDGGEHVDVRHPSTSLAAENVLRHDKSVYCSERPQCNIILKHADDTAFCLEKLHIVGPEMGFTAPVGAGVVVVGMGMGDLRRWTEMDEDRQVGAPPPHARRSRVSPYSRQDGRRRGRLNPNPARDRSSELLTIAEALRDPYINASLDRDGEVDSESDFATEEESDASCDPRPRTQPHTTLTNEDAGPEESSPQDVLDFRSQRERLMRRRYDIENWHRSREGPHPSAIGARDAEGWANDPTLLERAEREREREREREAIATLPLSRLLARSRMQDSPGPASGAERAESSSSSSPGSEQLPPLEPIPPPFAADNTSRPTLTLEQEYPTPPSLDHQDVTVARFAIQPDRHSVAITFDPPVSGRFVLVRCWAERGRGNVDVQSVVAKGWGGGRRWFPAVGMK